jgi:hypothetical protein
MAELQGPGLSKIYLDNFQLRQDYPQLLLPGYVTAIELSNFDVSSSTLKSEHIHALQHRFDFWLRFIVNKGEKFNLILTLGFHSNTGSLAFNMALGEQRATQGYDAINPQTKFDLLWKHASVIWREGDPDGETGAMRKVLIIFHGAEAPNIPLPGPRPNVLPPDLDLSSSPDIVGLKTMRDAGDDDS